MFQSLVHSSVNAMRDAMGNLLRVIPWPTCNACYHGQPATCVTMGNLQRVIPLATCNMCYPGQPATRDTMHAGKIISKIAHEQAKARVRMAAQALRLRVQPKCKAMHASPRSREKKCRRVFNDRSLHCGSNGIL